MRDSYGQEKYKYGAKDPIEAPAPPLHVTKAQISYIEILRMQLELTIPTRNAHICSILGKTFGGDVWGLSRSDASKIIAQFKTWITEGYH